MDALQPISGLAGIFAMTLKVTVVFTGVLLVVAYTTLAERRLSAFIQDRVGPNRVGIPLTLFGRDKDYHLFGLMQPIADAVKLFLKEDFTPSHVRKVFYTLAPAITAVPPWSPSP